jgi:hypothetical protein
MRNPVQLLTRVLDPSSPWSQESMDKINQQWRDSVSLPIGASERKATPIATGVLDYFPLALAEVARVSRIGNDQHNPGQPLHWAKVSG